MADSHLASVLPVLRRVAGTELPWTVWGTLSTGARDDRACETALEQGLLVEAGQLVALTDSGRMLVALFGDAVVPAPAPDAHCYGCSGSGELRGSASACPCVTADSEGP